MDINRISDLRLAIMESGLGNSDKEYLMCVTELSQADLGNAMATTSIIGAGTAIATDGIGAMYQAKYDKLQLEINSLCDKLKSANTPEKQKNIQNKINKLKSESRELQEKQKKCKKIKQGAVAASAASGVAAIRLNTSAIKNSVNKKFRGK